MADSATSDKKAAKKKAQDTIEKLNGAPVVEDEDKLEGPPVPHGKPMVISLSLLDIDETQNTRDKIDPTSTHYKELRASIHDVGLIEPVVVSEVLDKEGAFTGRYLLRIGYHRTLICKELGFEDIPVVVRTYAKSEDAYLANLAENIHRKNLRPYETAQALFKLHKLHGYSVESLQQKTKIGKTKIVDLIRCFDRLPKKIKEAWRRFDELTPLGTLYDISKEDSHSDMLERWALEVGSDAVTPPKKDKVGDKEKKPPKAQNRDAMKRFIAEIDAAESIVVRGEQMDLDDDQKEILRAGVRWCAGELKKYPLVLPPDDREEEDE